MLLNLSNGKYLSVDFIAEIKIRGNEPCKIWMKTFDGKWHHWCECENQEKAIEWIQSLLGEYII